MKTQTFEVTHEMTKIFEALSATPVERGAKVRGVMKTLNLGEQKALYFLEKLCEQCRVSHSSAHFVGKYYFWATPDNYAKCILTHCFSFFNWYRSEGLNRHSHSFKYSGKLSLGMPLCLRGWRFAWFQKFSILLI